MQKLFASSFRESSGVKHKKNTAELKRIDELIQGSAPEWPIDKIAKIDLAILRQSVYELAIQKKEPPKVIIDEAVEMGKEFGNDNSPKFINGVLGTILKSL